MWNWMKKLWAKQDGPVSSEAAVGQMLAGTRGVALPPQTMKRERRRVARTTYVNPAPPQSSDDGLLTGIIIGEMLSSNSPSEQPAIVPDTTSGFSGFGGGESGGGGASGSWDAPSSDPAPSCDTSSSSFDSGSSSCDSGSSFDSGSSSSGSDF